MSDSHSAEKKKKTRPSENQTTIWLPRQKTSLKETRKENDANRRNETKEMKIGIKR